MSETVYCTKPFYLINDTTKELIFIPVSDPFVSYGFNSKRGEDYIIYSFEVGFNTTIINCHHYVPCQMPYYNLTFGA